MAEEPPTITGAPTVWPADSATWFIARQPTKCLFGVCCLVCAIQISQRNGSHRHAHGIKQDLHPRALINSTSGDQDETIAHSL